MKHKIKRLFQVSQFLVVLLLVLTLTKANVSSKDDRISNNNYNKVLDLTAMAIKLNEFHMEDIYYPLDTFTGSLTGYSADCPACNGHLGCTGQNVLDGTLTYNDKTYGEVLIVASSKNLKCGSIICFDSKRVSDEKVYAIVLDRGVGGNDIDLLSPSEEYASKYIGRSKITYDVLRFGWSR